MRFLESVVPTQLSINNSFSLFYLKISELQLSLRIYKKQLDFLVHWIELYRFMTFCRFKISSTYLPNEFKSLVEKWYRRITEIKPLVPIFIFPSPVAAWQCHSLCRANIFLLRVISLKAGNKHFSGTNLNSDAGMHYEYRKTLGEVVKISLVHIPDITEQETSSS